MASITMLFSGFLKYLASVVCRMLGRKSRSSRTKKQTRKRRCRIAEPPECIQESRRSGQKKQTRKRRCGIAELPECIQESILSLIPLADAANASLVCRAWRPFSLRRRNLVFDFDNVYGSKYKGFWNEQRFVRSVDTYLQHYKGDKVDSFIMKAGDVDVDLDRCVRFAIAKGVKHLDLRGGRCNYVFPHDSVSDFGGFSQLVTLHLCDVVIHPSFTSNLSSIFASLESLTLHDVGVRNDLDTITDMNIVAGDRLTDLKVRYCEGKIKISARNLASLEYVGGYFSSLTINTPSLARIDLLEMHQQRLLMSPDLLVQLGTCSNVESLCMRMEPETLVNFKMPAFGNLRKLEVDICSSRYRYNNNDDNLFGFLDFLKAAPLLEELVTALLIRHLKFTDERQIRSVSAGFTHDNLKFFKMKNFHTHWSEIEFAFCILKYARNLKVMEIGPFAERDFVDRTKVNYYREEAKYPAGCMLSEKANGKQMLFDLIHFMSKEVEEVKTDAQIVLLTSLPTCAKKVRQNAVSNSFHLLAQACSTK